MPVYDDGQERNPPVPTVSVSGSVTIELEWILHSALRKDFAADHPALRALFGDNPRLVDEIVGLWEKDGQTGAAGFAELVFVAHHAEVLLTVDAGALLDTLPAACASVPTTLRSFPMRAETADDRRLVLDRLARLRRSAVTRRHYVDVLARTWEAASGSWERFGREAVAASVAAKRSMLTKGAGWREISQGACHGDTGDRIVADLGPRAEIVVVPAFFAHVGLLYDFPSLAVFGVKADESGAESRARTEDLARRIRAISDPTRLAFLDTLRSGPKTVTELAVKFGLAQPTVSNHVKILRDGGIVTVVRDGTRRNIVVRNEVVDDLMDDLSRVLKESSGSQTTQQ
jgi:DNA-binding transcriptional ArsR family regulator